MPIAVICHACGKTMRIGDEVAGKRFRCNGCSAILTAPAVAAPPPPAATAPVRPRRTPAAPEVRPRAKSGRPPRSAKSAPAEPVNPPRQRNGLSRRRGRIRQGRDYLHDRCGSQTRVDGPEFAAMADPLAEMRRTYCTECADFFPVEEFRWTDTDECITDYYERHGAAASPAQRLIASRTGLLTTAAAGLVVGLLAGAAVGFQTGWTWGLIIAMVLGLSLAVAGLFLHSQVIAPQVLKRVCGVADPRMLD